MVDKKDRKEISKLASRLEVNNEMLQKSNWVVSKGKKKKLEQQNIEIENKLQEFRIKYNDESLVEKIKHENEVIHQENIENSIFTKIGNSMEKTGDKLDKAGRKMVKTGLKTTAITWTPLVYAGYKVGKVALSKDETPESQYVKLIKECEQAYKEGKIDEETMKYYITDYANNHYRK